MEGFTLEESMKEAFADTDLVMNQSEASILYRLCKVFALQKKLDLQKLDAVIEARWSSAGLKSIKRLAR